MLRSIFLLLAVMLPVVGSAFHYKGSTLSVNTYKSLEVTARQIAKDYDLGLLNISYGGIADSSSQWGISYTSHKQMTQEEVRPLLKSIISRHTQKLYQDPVFLEYYQKLEKERKQKPFGPDWVAFKLAFWDENVDRPLFPYLSQVRYANNQIYYHYADPKTQALLPPTTESLESLDIKFEP